MQWRDAECQHQPVPQWETLRVLRALQPLSFLHDLSSGSLGSSSIMYSWSLKNWIMSRSTRNKASNFKKFGSLCDLRVKVPGLSSTKFYLHRPSHKLVHCSSLQLCDVKDRALSKSDKSKKKIRKPQTFSWIVVAQTLLVGAFASSPYPDIGSKHACAATHRSHPA